MKLVFFHLLLTCIQPPFAFLGQMFLAKNQLCHYINKLLGLELFFKEVTCNKDFSEGTEKWSTLWYKSSKALCLFLFSTISLLQPLHMLASLGSCGIFVNKIVPHVVFWETRIDVVANPSQALSQEVSQIELTVWKFPSSLHLLLWLSVHHRGCWS